jgi:uncharacterized DUF497 family protein
VARALCEHPADLPQSLAWEPTLAIGIRRVYLRYGKGGYAVGFAFVFDQAKSRANRAKHGIDFIEAQALWLDPNRVSFPARTENEPRFMVVGSIEGKHWSAVATHRGDTVRLISVRRSRREEVESYEGE